MAGIFKVNEVVGIAVEIEKRGEAFYREMAQKVYGDGLRNTLEFLAGEELKHQRYFSTLLERLAPLQIPAGSSESEYWAYVNDLIDSHFLFDDRWSHKLVSSATTDQEVIQLAMGFEKESILFFSEMKGLVPTGETNTVEKCMEEERKHLRRLAQMMKPDS